MSTSLLNNQFLNDHVKIISRNEMIVFVTEPFRIESYVHPIGYYNGKNKDIAKMVDGCLVLTPYGYHCASRTFTNLSRKVQLFWSHKSELKAFIEDYHDSRANIEQEIAESRKITNEYRRKADWNRAADSFKSQRRLMEQSSTLYRDMYIARFGKDEGFLFEDEIEDFFKKITEKNTGN